MHPRLLQAMARQPAFKALETRLPGDAGSVTIGGLPGSAPALVLATLAHRTEHRVWLAVAASPPEAEALEADLGVLLGTDRVVLYPQREALPFEAEEHHIEVSGRRVEALEALLSGRVRILVTTHRAIQEREKIPSALTDLRVTLATGAALRPAELAERLELMGFERTALVEGVGQFAVRGGIVDLFSFGAVEPVRVEFWGDEIESIRRFDVLDQRSTGELAQAAVLPVDLRLASATSAGVRRTLLDVVPPEAVLMLVEPEGAEPAFRRAWEHLLRLHEAERRHRPDIEPPESLFLDPHAAREALASFGRLCLVPAPDAEIRFDAHEPEPIERDMERLRALLRAGAARGEQSFVLCENPGQLERLEELLDGGGALPAGAALALGTVSGGFVLEGADPPVRVLTDHEIFRRARRVRRGRRFRGAVALESLAQLKPGDYVVHLDHGVGRFLEMERVTVGNEEIESLAIEYAGGEVLRLPVYRLDLIERWVPDREDAEPPKVHKIGGKSWTKLKRRTEKAIREMAAELLQLYAAREMAEGHAFPPDTRWQKEMESSFLYEDTPDQRQATVDVKQDMESPRPMDRLVCGDVGYGKTEVAIRAAFKAAQDDTQVAVLAPTTILVEQHVHTFRERLAGYPVRVEALSRFRTPAEQKRILADLAAGAIDIVIGTHRLLEPDAAFRQLGLLVVDEEQRFGVRQKERLKDLKRNIDVLSMTATPIPRTLHLSLAGLRDMSLIQTPPRDRMPIITHVVPWMDEVMEDAIRRELDRGGQVFVVHNRVQSIGAVAERVRGLVPDACVDIAHGQQPAAALDDVMRRFLDGDVNVLVSTAIIENGLDVPTANTLIVDRADLFGLAQLYQLRGRVGRSHHRAFCYLILPESATDHADKRLRILEQYTELGSGYAIALKDLELRGAGNLLGAEQSGFVHAVGVDTYTRLLEQTVRRLKGQERPERFPPPDVALDGAAYLPDSYVPEASQKLHLYRRLSRMEQPADIQALRAELADRFGPPPPEVDRLLSAAELRLLGRTLGISGIRVTHDRARIGFRNDVVPHLAVLQGAMHDQQIEVEVRRTLPLSLVLHRLGAESLPRTLARALDLLVSDARAA
ncbi:MAG: transcription-repair coupling factor [Gemmatimonadota bacterium]|jgi:transcription-repair coupling factor (superfamily II helicase)